MIPQLIYSNNVILRIAKLSKKTFTCTVLNMMSVQTLGKHERQTSAAATLDSTRLRYARTGLSKSSIPILSNISCLFRSATALTASAPSSTGST